MFGHTHPEKKKRNGMVSRYSCREKKRNGMVSSHFHRVQTWLCIHPFPLRKYSVQTSFAKKILKASVDLNRDLIKKKVWREYIYDVPR